MKTLLLTFGLAAFAFSATAQTASIESKPAVASAVATTEGHDCLMKADAKTWETLGLTADQTKRVQELQAQAKGDAKAHANSDEQVKAVLSPEQFAKYTEWCKGVAKSTDKATTPSKESK
jgi:Spy/CpxP family protein refolding chaperone